MATAGLVSNLPGRGLVLGSTRQSKIRTPIVSRWATVWDSPFFGSKVLSWNFNAKKRKKGDEPSWSSDDRQSGRNGSTVFRVLSD